MENFDELEKAMDVKTEIVKETKSVKVKPVKNEEMILKKITNIVEHNYIIL